LRKALDGTVDPRPRVGIDIAGDHRASRRAEGSMLAKFLVMTGGILPRLRAAVCCVYGNVG
jgi:hypothetical protein